MLQSRLVQAIDPGDPLDPSRAPVRQIHLAGRAVDKIPAHVGPTERKDHQPPEKAHQPLVGAVAVADDDRAEESFAEQLVRRLGAAARIDMEADRVAADRGPQPGPARPVFPAKLLDAPTGLVGMAQRRLVLVRKDRVGHGLEQRHEALQTIGQGPGRDRQALAGEPRGNAVHGAEAGTVLEQKARPEAGPVERSGEQPRHRGRRDFHGRRRALAGPAPARTADHALVGLDLDLDEGGFLGAVRRIGLPAPSADAHIGRRVVLFGALIEAGPLGAAVAGRAVLLAAWAPGARLLLLLALAAVERPRQHGPGRAKPREIGFQRLDPVARHLRALAQPGVLTGQGPDRGLPAPRSAQDPAQLGVHAGQRCRQCLPGRAKPGKAGFRRRPAGLCRLHGLAQPGILLVQPADRGLLAPRPPQDVAQVIRLVERQLRQRRPGRAQLRKPGLQLVLPGLGHFQGMAQPVSLVGQRPDPGLAVAQYPPFPVETKGLAGQLLAGLPEALRPLLPLLQPLVLLDDLLVPPGHLLVEPGGLLAQRPDRGPQALRLFPGRRIPAGFPGAPPGGVLHGLRLRQGLAQPGDFLAERLDRAGLARPVAGFGEERLQAHRFRPQGRRGLCRAAEFLRLLVGLAQPAPAGPEARLPRTGVAPRSHFRPAQLFRARFQPRPPAPVPAPRGRAPAHTASASRAAGAPARQRETTEPRRHPRPASDRRQNPRREPPCKRR